MLKSNLRRPALAPALLSLACGACTVEVIDRTSSPFTYDPRIIPQTFQVEVLSTGNVDGVVMTSPGAGVAPMAPIGNGRWETRLRVPECAGAVEFSVDVRYQSVLGPSTKTFPEAGAFTHQVAGLPERCEAFSDNYAQTFVVDETRDFPDSNPGNGECGHRRERGCSLRAAVMEANAKPGNDLIRVPVGRYVLTRGGLGEDTNGIDHSIRDLDITESVTIEGMSGANIHLGYILERTTDPATDLTDNGNQFGFVRIDGDGRHRVFHVTAPDVVLRLRRLAILHGSEAGAGGGILNKGTLTLERVVLAENYALSDRRRTFGGGGIQNDGVLIGEEVAFAQNIVGHLRPSGGGLHNTGEATLSRVLFAYNDAEKGAAVYNRFGTLVLDNVTVYGNNGSGQTASTVIRTERGETWLNFATLAAHVLDDSSRPEYPLSVLVSGGATTRVRNGLWVDNTGVLCGGGIRSGGGNVVEGECSNLRFDLSVASAPLAPDHQNVGPVAGTGQLVDRGGFLPVVEIDAPVAGSSAFDARDLGSAPPFPFTDQRGEGFDRRVDGNGDGIVRSDPGAYEYAPRRSDPGAYEYAP